MPDQRPNIIVITTDQQRCDSLGCYGSSFVHTPNLDRFAAQGALFQRAYCTNPVCTPSRVSIFTGRYVSRHGAWNVGMNAPDDTVMLSHRLADVGYRTHYVGKIHFQAFGGEPGQSMEGMKGWEQRFAEFHGPYYGFQSIEVALGHGPWGTGGHYGHWLINQFGRETFDAYHKSKPVGIDRFPGCGSDWSIPTEHHYTTWTADRSIAFMQQHDRAQPFLLAIGFQDPHHPHGVPTDYAHRLDPATMPVPPFTPGELNDKPPHFYTAHTGTIDKTRDRGRFWVAGQGAGYDYRTVRDDDARLGRSYYHTMVRMIDDQMGRLLNYLDESGLADNTLVVFTSDHSEMLGDHGIWMKGPFHYETMIRVPMMARWPRGFGGGRRVDSLFSLADITPTCLAAAGLKPPSDLDGADALPMLRGNVAATRDHVLVEMCDDPDALDLKTIVTSTRKLTTYAGRDTGELFDLEADPGELTNHWNDPAYATDKTELLRRLQSLQIPDEMQRRCERYCYA